MADGALGASSESRCYGNEAGNNGNTKEELGNVDVSDRGKVRVVTKGSRLPFGAIWGSITWISTTLYVLNYALLEGDDVTMIPTVPGRSSTTPLNAGTSCLWIAQFQFLA